MIPRYTHLLIIVVATNFTAKASDPFKAHNEAIKRERRRDERTATHTMQHYIQQGKPVPPLAHLSAPALVYAQQHNARLAAQHVATPQPNPNPVQQKKDGCAQQ